MTEDKSIFTAEYDARTDREKVLDRTGLTEDECWVILDRLSSLFTAEELEEIKRDSARGRKILKHRFSAVKRRPPPAEINRLVEQLRAKSKLSHKEACAQVGKELENPFLGWQAVSGITIQRDVLKYRKSLISAGTK